MQNLMDWFSGLTLIGLLGMIWKNARESDNKLSGISKDIDIKISRGYQRLDEVKSKNDEQYAHKDVCEVLHKQIDSKLTEISLDVKTLLRNNGHK